MTAVATDARQTVAQQAARRVMAARRRRVFRSVLLFSALTAIMVVLSMANRDKEAQRACERRMVFALEMLQHAYEQEGGLPPELPVQPETGPRRLERERLMRGHFHYRVPVGVPLKESSVIGIACCARTHDFFLRTDGRHVLVFRAADRRFELRWLPEDQFQQEAPGLGLPTTPPPGG